jgi:hypothetical protein
LARRHQGLLCEYYCLNRYNRPVQQVRTLLEQFVAREIIEARPVKQGSFRYRLRREMAPGGEQ